MSQEVSEAASRFATAAAKGLLSAANVSRRQSAPEEGEEAESSSQPDFLNRILEALSTEK